MKLHRGGERSARNQAIEAMKHCPEISGFGADSCKCVVRLWYQYPEGTISFWR